MPPELAQWIPPAVIIGVMLYLHRMTRQEIAQLRQDMKDVESRLGSRMDRVEAQIGELRDRLGRIEGRLDELREFFFRSGGTAA